MGNFFPREVQGRVGQKRKVCVPKVSGLEGKKASLDFWLGLRFQKKIGSKKTNGEKGELLFHRGGFLGKFLPGFLKGGGFYTFRLWGGI